MGNVFEPRTSPVSRRRYSAFRTLPIEARPWGARERRVESMRFHICERELLARRIVTESCEAGKVGSVCEVLTSSFREPICAMNESEKGFVASRL